MAIDMDVVEAQLQRSIDEHAETQRYLTILFGIAAAGAWLLSYLVLSLIAFSSLVGLLLTLLLGVDIWRRLGRAATERAEHRSQLAGEETLADDDDETPVWQRILDNSLLLAPRVTVRAIQAWRQRREWSEAELAAAGTLLQHLLARPAWMGVAELPTVSDVDRFDVLEGLLAMQVVWQRRQDDRMELRANPLFRKECGVQVGEAAMAATPGVVGITPGEDPFANIGRPPPSSVPGADAVKKEDRIDVDLD